MRPAIALFMVLLLMAASCKCGKQGVVYEDKVSSPLIPEDMQLMVVVDSRDLDGCNFLLRAEDSTYYDPGTLSSEFCVDGMKVYVKYRLAKNSMSICMRGKQIILSEIKRAEK